MTPTIAEKYFSYLYFLASQDTRERERERDVSIDGGVTSGKDGRGHGSVDPAYAELRSGV